MSERIALGFCNNVDYEILWNAKVLEDLIVRYQIRAEEPTTRAEIQSERDLVISILGFMQVAEGGERFVSHSGLIERFARRFDKKITLGGTSVRAAIAMRKLGYTSALHLITQNEHVRRLIPPDSPYVCSNPDDSAHPHLIVQFGLDDRVRAGDIDIRARQSNRLIYHCNADRIAMKLNPDFAGLIPEAKALLISGFNAMQSERLLADRLEAVLHMLGHLPADATVLLEDGGYFEPRFRQVILHALGHRVDIYSMNEDELQTHLQRRVPLRDAAQVQAAVREVHSRIPATTLVVHTQHWALAHGPSARRYAEALTGGVTLATTRFRFGDDFTPADCREIAGREPPPADARFAHKINAAARGSAYCVAVAEVEQRNGTTIGLGDAFVGGFLPALLR